MANRKPAGRPVRKYERSGTDKIKPGRTTGKLTSKSGNPEQALIKKEVELIRLNRFIANSGVCSRRDADEHIKNGFISVNGKIVTDMGTKVTYEDDVRFKTKRLSAEKKVYIL